MKAFILPWLAAGLCVISGAVSAAELSGRLAYAEQAHLGPLVSGVVAKVNAEVGQSVKRGALLIKLDDRGFRADLAAARARAKHAALLLQEAQAEHDRAEELYERTVLSEVERTQAQIQLASAEAQAAEARAGQTNAQLALERASLKAPFDGVVELVDAVAGEGVLANDEIKVLVVVAKRSRMQLSVPADPAQAQAAMADGAARVRVAGRELAVAQLRISSQGRTWTLVAEFEVPEDLQLSAGGVGQLVWGQ